MPRLLPVGVASVFLLGTAFAGPNDPATPAPPKTETPAPAPSAPEIDPTLRAKLLFAFTAGDTSEADVVSKFAGLKLGSAELEGFEKKLDQWITAAKANKDVPPELDQWHQEMTERMGLVRPAVKAPPKVDLNAGQQAAAKAEELGQQDPRQRNDGDNRTTQTETSAPRLPNAPGDTGKIENQEQERQRSGNMAGKFIPSPDKEKEKEGGPVVDEKFRSLLKMGALGAMAGALVGIGLLPLFGPMGIFMGALMGGAMMVVTKKLSG